MDFLSAFRVAASGLSAQRTRINLVASNLANAETTRTAEGGPYKRRDAVLAAVPLDQSFDEEMQTQIGERAHEVQVVAVEADQEAPRLVYDPDHPDANAEGNVAMPNIDTVTEMVNLVDSSRSYEANGAAVSTIKQMTQLALTIGT